jgi:hypothetical protein
MEERDPTGKKPRSPSRDPETTMDLMRALEDAAIVVEEPVPQAPPPTRPPGYNPYDKEPAKPHRKR